MRASSSKPRVTASERIRHVEDYIHTFRSSKTSLLHPLWNIRALQDECRHAGFEDVSEICSQLESRVIQLGMTPGLKDEAVLAELLGITHNIRQRVERAAG